MTLDEFMNQLRLILEKNDWDGQESDLHRMDRVVKASNEILDLPGDWILIDANQTIRDMLMPER